MSSSRFNLKLNEIVIGSSVEAALFAYYGKHRVLFTRQDPPTDFDKIEDFGLGDDLGKMWDKYMFLLSIGGYIPFANKVKFIRYVDANTLKVITHDETVCIVNFDKLYIFDDHNIVDLPLSPSTTNNRVRIVDWFYVERGNIHEHNFIQNNTDFMNQVYFFRNSIRKTAKRKDVCVVTYCEKDKLDDYPEHLIRIKTENLMRELGIETATPHKTSIKIDHKIRDIKELGKNIYTDFDNVKFVYDDLKFIHETKRRGRKIDYMKYLSMKMGIV